MDLLKVLFYAAVSGRSPVEEFLHECSEEVRGEFLDAVSLLEQGRTLSMPLSRNLSGIHPGLHELRLRDRTGIMRFFYLIKKNEAIYLIHAIKKKTQQLPKNDVDLIFRRLKEV